MRYLTVLLWTTCGVAACGGSTDWNPEKADLIYTTQVGEHRGIVRRSAATGAVVGLTTGPGTEHWGRVSPDGRRLLFQTRSDDQWDIAVQPLEGGTPVEVLVSDPAEDVLPEWSPFGDQIIFFSSRGENRGPNGELRGNLFVLDLQSRDLTRLTATPLPSSFGGVWSPDGRSVVFSRPFDGDVELVQLDVVTGAELRLTQRPGSDYGARFAPDGTRLAFHSERDGTSRIAVLDMTTRQVTELTDGGLHYGPVFSPDGQWLVFSGTAAGQSQVDVLMVPSAGGPIVPLVATEADERSASWLPMIAR